MFRYRKTREVDIDDVLSTAYHEAGHAEVLNRHNIQVKRIAVGEWGGVTEPKHRIDQRDLEAFAVCAVAGQESEVAWLQRQHGYTREEALAETAHGASSDMANFADYTADGGITEQQARAKAQELIRRHWRDIERLAERVRSRGELGRWSI